MAVDDKEVEEILGSKCWSLLLGYVKNGRISKQNFEDISRLLSDGLTDSRILGNHLRRNACDEAEWRKMLTDWYNEELYDLDRNAAVEKLARILKHPSVNLRVLAKKVEQCLPKKSRTRDKKSRFVKLGNFLPLKFLYLLISQNCARGQVSIPTASLSHGRSRIQQESEGR